MLQKKIKLQRAQRRMPWYMAPKKDVTSCDKLRGAANELRSADFRMRKLTSSNVLVFTDESIVLRREPRELKHLSTWRKRKKIDSESSGERNRKSPNRIQQYVRGSGPQMALKSEAELFWKSRTKRVKSPYANLIEGQGYPEYVGTRGILTEYGRTIS